MILGDAHIPALPLQPLADAYMWLLPQSSVAQARRPQAVTSIAYCMLGGHMPACGVRIAEAARLMALAESEQAKCW